MKLITLMLIISIMHVSAKGFGQVTLDEANTPIAKVLQLLKKQSGYYFFYDENEIKNQKITIKVTNATLEQALYQCFKNTDFTYEILEKNVVITTKKIAATKLIMLVDSVKGRIVDADGNPMKGATVALKYDKSVKPYFTNANGEFVFYHLSDKNAILEISYVGYEIMEVRASSNLQNILMKLSNAKLDEIHVIAYGKESRRFSVASSNTLSSDDIEKQPVTNVLLALQGQIPGLIVNPSGGVPGSSVRIQIRGENNLQNAGNFNPFSQPLFIIDGVPFAPQNNRIDNISSISQTGRNNVGLSPFNSINPNDIESITVLKDADATSIYGSQGANGVVLITTKKVKPGKTTFEVALNSGYNFTTSNIKLLNTQQYVALRKEAYISDGITPDVTNPFDPSYAPDLLIFDQNKYTDWRKKIIGKTSNNTDVHTTLSGGTYNNTFILSAGYTQSNYNFPGDLSDKRMTIHSGFHHKSTNNKLSLDFNTDYAYDHNNSIISSSATSGILLAPNLPDLLNNSGNLLWNYNGVSFDNYQFYAYLKQPSLNQSYNLNNSLKLTYKIANGLSLGANFGYNRLAVAERNAVPASSLNPVNFPSSSAAFANSAYQTFNVEPQINYQHTTTKGDLSILAGGTFKKNIYNNTNLIGSNYSNENLLGTISGAASVYASANDNQYKYAAVFGRVKYIYDHKYIVSITGRRDGSSNFGPDNRFGNFGSAGIGWILSEWYGFKQALPFVSYAKISGNYGTSGSDAIAPYQYQAFWQPAFSGPNFQGTRPYLPSNLYNPNYHWALKKSLNAGLDLGFINDRLLFNATYYNNREGNQLIDYTLPSQAGLPSVLQNFNATIENSGWEFTLTSNHIKSNDFNWTTNFNISFNRNKLLAFPGLENSSYASFYILGKSTSTIIGYNYKGVNPQTGLFEFYNGKGEVSNNLNPQPATQGGDKVPIADLQPKFFGGFGNNISYKNLSLSFFFQFAKQTAPNYLYSLYSSSNAPGNLSNAPVAILGNYWKAPGDNAQLQRLTTSSYSDAAYNFTQSSGAYSNDTYVRLKTVALSFTLPDAYLKKVNIKNCRIFINGQNLLTFTNYKVGDPEQPGTYTGFPIQRTVVVGLSFNL